MDLTDIMTINDVSRATGLYRAEIARLINEHGIRTRRISAATVIDPRDLPNLRRLAEAIVSKKKRRLEKAARSST